MIVMMLRIEHEWVVVVRVRCVVELRVVCCGVFDWLDCVLRL